MVGGTGTVGRHVVAELARSGVPFRALVRSPEAARAVAGPGTEPVIGDLARPASLDAALDGITRALLVSPLDPRQVELQGNFVEAARRARAAKPVHVVKLSGLATALDSPVRSGRLHARTERQIEDAGLPFTHLRPPFFMQNLLGQAGEVAATGTLPAPADGGRIAMVDARDVAAVAVAALTGAGHEGKVYTVTGPEALSSEDIAAALAAATGQPVTSRRESPEARRARLVASGMPDWYVDLRMEFWTVLAAGGGAATTDTVLAVTGAPPRSFARFAREHAGRFTSGGA